MMRIRMKIVNLKADLAVKATNDAMKDAEKLIYAVKATNE